MIIPKSFVVGPSRYDVLEVEVLDKPPSFGRIDTLAGKIYLARKDTENRLYRVAQRQEAFWHEALHAIYVDMGVPLHKHDETLIDALAKRLTQVCNTAEV